MASISLQQAALWCDGSIDPKYAHITFSGANFDSRKLEPGQLFVAIQAARDGHDFIPMAMEKGAAAVLCSRPVGDRPAILVADSRIALGKIAAGYLEAIGAKVVGVTGSVGKSTTKEMIAAVLETAYRVSKTPANHNNDLGMPCAVLAMGDDTQIAVLEMGMSHFGEIAYLSQMAKPDVAVIINIGTMHMENLGSQEGILQAKLEITQGMKQDGKLILFGDDPYLWKKRNDLPVKTQYFGIANETAEVRAETVLQTENGIRYNALCREGSFSVLLPLEGMHYVPDSLAAVSVGLHFGVTPAQIRKGLSEFETMAGRQEILEMEGLTVIKDCYNAGPESMAAALQVLGNRPGRKIAVLGDMLELGSISKEAHRKVGDLAAEKADFLLCCGADALYIRQGALEGGMPEENARHYTDRQQMAEDLAALARPGDILLFKGSRGMKMEEILDGFLKGRKT